MYRLFYNFSKVEFFAIGKIVTVFNISGNKYRLVTAIHYNTRTLFTLQLMTHAEYSKNRWKAKL